MSSRVRLVKESAAVPAQPAISTTLQCLALALCVLLGCVVRARAQPPASGATASVTPNLTVRPDHGYWSTGEPRWFVSTRSEVGTPYIRPYFSGGYGLEGVVIYDEPEVATLKAQLRAARPTAEAIAD